MGFVSAAVEAGLAQARPEILNSDQGSQFTSPAYIQLVEAAGVQISMDGRGRAIDNVFTERLWRTLKYEEVYLKEYSSPREARRSIGQYLEFYNHRRLHQALGYRTLAEVYSSGITNSVHALPASICQDNGVHLISC
ncbi:integrase [Limnochorda pilosa]|uniref:Integrase n=1 Tax=Limnochorda pilosa TaxID=1555112 RepID=A0A0K2SIY4_LIMPI|nr:integrase [Limnochorda pilosa]